MFRPTEQFVSVKLSYDDVTAEQAAAVKELVRSNGDRDNTLVVMGFADYSERTRSLAVSADLQPGITENELVTAIERRIIARNLVRT